MVVRLNRPGPSFDAGSTGVQWGLISLACGVQISGPLPFPGLSSNGKTDGLHPSNESSILSGSTKFGWVAYVVMALV